MEEVQIEASIYGPVAVIRGVWSSHMHEKCLEHAIIGLELNQGKGWTGSSLAFLADFPNLKIFKILDFSIRDIEPVHHLTELRELGISTYCKTPIDFAAFTLLQECSLEWRPRCKGLFEASTLESLFLNSYKGNLSCPFGSLSNLHSLSILNSPIREITGLGSLCRLTRLRLGLLRKLSSLAGVERLCNLEWLTVHTCRQISSIGEVASLSRLRKLHVNNDGDIESLRPIQGLPELEEVIFYESTNILDGDLSVLLSLQKLSSVAFKARKHYTHRSNEIRALIADR